MRPLAGMDDLANSGLLGWPSWLGACVCIDVYVYASDSTGWGGACDLPSKGDTKTLVIDNICKLLHGFLRDNLPLPLNTACANYFTCYNLILPTK